MLGVAFRLTRFFGGRKRGELLPAPGSEPGPCAPVAVPVPPPVLRGRLALIQASSKAAVVTLATVALLLATLTGLCAYRVTPTLWVILDHGPGLYAGAEGVARRNYRTLFFHLSRIEVGNGLSIKRGQVIGRVGSTGTSAGNHLHYEVRVDGQPIDPESYVLDRP